MPIPRLTRKRTARPSPANDHEISSLVQLWLLRMLVPLGAHRSFIDRNSGLSNNTLAEAVGLNGCVDWPDDPFDASAARAALRKNHADAERPLSQDHPPALPPVLAHNIERLAALVGLSTVDQAILAFAVHLHSDRLLDDTADWLGALSSSKVFHVLSVLLDMPVDQVRTALAANGVLARSGLVTIDRSTGVLRGKLELLSDNFADHVSSDDVDPIALLRDVVSAASPAHLTLADYPHIERDLALLQPYLRHAVATGRQGVNVFLHGAPGTGKSQLVKVLAQAMGCELFEVASEDSDGDPVSGARRLRAFRAAQSFFGQQKVLILFDEVEDVFDDDDSLRGHRSTAQSRKAWINRTLEENPVPAFWLSNSVQNLDPAFVRRFDMFIELPVPPRPQRERILQSACGTLLDAATLKRLSRSDQLAPAVVSRAAAVVHCIAPELGSKACADAFQLLVNQTLKAQGHPAMAANDPTQLPEVYDPAFICADADLAQLARGIAHTRSGRLCLFGPPGTGKTACGHWLAEQMGAPLLVNRASDLVSKYLGETEQNMARAFRQATQEGAVLLMDEVDSFLQDRRGAQRSWEVSQVNEMLTQMEAFAGVFIASTNLMNQLDPAALRRFDLNVKFDYLRPAQAIQLFDRYSKLLFKDKRQGTEKLKENVGGVLGVDGGSAHDAAQGAEHELVHARVARLRNLTPGDFAAVVRQNRLQPIGSPSGLVGALEKVCGLKEGGTHAAMGFLA